MSLKHLAVLYGTAISVGIAVTSASGVVLLRYGCAVATDSTVASVSRVVLALVTLIHT
jgi:hypothetical protein